MLSVKKGCVDMTSCIFELNIPNVGADRLYDFLVNPYEEKYGWRQLGDDFFFSITTYGKENRFSDATLAVEYLGEKRRVNFNGKRATFFGMLLRRGHPMKFKWWAKNMNVRIPMIMELELYPTDEGALVKHKLCLGYSSMGKKLLNPLVRLYCNKSFRKKWEEHCEVEWLKLAERLAG